MPKAISYIRFSANHQGRGSTTARQQGMIAAWLGQHKNIERSNLSEEDLGRSGFKGEHLNHGLGKILAAIKDKKIKPGDYILVEAVDRIGRLEVLKMIEIISNIVNSDVTIVTLEDGQEYTKERLSTDYGAIHILVGKILQAHDYSKRLSRRVLDSYEIKRAEARDGIRIKKANPYWLDSHGNSIERNSEIVKECISLYLKGYGTRKIILVRLEKFPELKGKHPTTLKRWFSDRSLIGEWSTNGETIQGVYEPLITTVEFYLLQKEMKKRAKHMSPEQTYALSGLVVCNNCGGRYYYRRKKHKEQTIIYANCSTYLKRGAAFCNNNTTWPYEALLYIIDGNVPIRLSSKIWKEKINNLSTKIDTLKEEQAEINKNIEKLLDILIEIPNQPNVTSRIAKLEAQKSEKAKEILAIENTMMNEESSLDFLDMDIEVIEESNEEIEKITSDPIAFREALKASHFKISVSGKTAHANLETQDDWKFHLIKRSTRHKCYVLKIETPDIEGIDEEDVSILIEEGECYYVAIDREGQLASARSQKDLFLRLEAMYPEKNHDRLFIHPPR